VHKDGGPTEGGARGAGRGDGCVVFRPNVDLVRATARHLGVEEEAILEGVARTKRDIGALRVWRYESGEVEAPCFVVNAFAANDPESTLQAHDRVLEVLPHPPEQYAGLLNLRADRGDRTLQWIHALKEGALDRFGRLFVCGLHARALRRRMKSSEPGHRIEVLSPGRPVDMMKAVRAGLGGSGGVVFGFGNIGGPGENLVRYWRETGEPISFIGSGEEVSHGT
ncbi:hypothetical protein ACFL3S_00160, partial [Gemmatimonadota bacterium]